MHTKDHDHKTKKRRLITLLHLIALCSAIFGISALSVPQKTQAQTESASRRHSEISLIPERIAIRPGEEIILATQIDLASQWHTYWRNPGDSGLPVSIKWDLPEGFEVSDIVWPTPDKVSYDVLANYGYFDRVTLLQTLKVPDTIPQGEIPLKADIEILVCNKICIPEYDNLQIELNDPDNLNADNSAKILAAQTKLPNPISGQFFYSDQETALHLSLTPEDRTILNTATPENTEFFPYALGIISHAATPEVTLNDDTLTITHERGNEPIDAQSPLQGLLVIKGQIGQNTGYTLSAIPQSDQQKPVIVNKANISGSAATIENSTTNNQDVSLTWISALALAFLGGLILNLMPCVFPVLSIKAISLVEMKGQEAKRARIHGLAYTAGIIISFLAIAGVLIALKHAGAAIGWGFQLQNPLVVGLLTYLLFLIGLNLAGIFEIGSGLSNVGQNLTGSHSYTSSFFTGALASIIATPCTAPFMGAAMGFALTQPTIVSLSVFAMLGFGMALPYLLLSFIPQTQALLPKPGAWMETFRQFLAFPLFASSLWLIWVLSKQAGTASIFLVLFGLLSLTFAVWLSGKAKKASGFGAFLARTTMILAIIGTLYTLSALNDIQPDQAADNTAITQSAKQDAIPYSREKLPELLKGDDPVFVEMTAAWCITCKVNQVGVLNTQAIHDLFTRKNVQRVVGDWTNHNPEVTEYLSTFERDGVPFYVYYGKRDPVTKRRPQAAILPQILTINKMRQTIDKCENENTTFFYNTLTQEGDDSCPTE
ncbi:MAG: protein-disulfide reductase DsbD family protein [Alphaproteobacteria bacterium]